MASCLINGVTSHNSPYGSHRNVYRATVMYGKFDKSFDMSGYQQCWGNALRNITRYVIFITFIELE